MAGSTWKDRVYIGSQISQEKFLNKIGRLRGDESTDYNRERRKRRAKKGEARRERARNKIRQVEKTRTP